MAKKEEDDYIDVTITIFGDDGAGKRSFLHRFINKSWLNRTAEQPEVRANIYTELCTTEYSGVLIDLDFNVISSNANIESEEVQKLLKKSTSSILCYNYADYASITSVEAVSISNTTFCPRKRIN